MKYGKKDGRRPLCPVPAASLPGTLRRLGELVLPPVAAGTAAVGGGKMNGDKPLPQCPFYVSHDQGSIRCEGLWKGSVLESRFAKEQERAGVMAAWCTGREAFRQCPLYRLLWEKYDEGGGH